MKKIRPQRLQKRQRATRPTGEPITRVVGRLTSQAETRRRDPGQSPRPTRKRPPRWDTEVRAGGRISPGGFALTNQLVRLAATRASGVLVIRTPETTAEVTFRAGDLARVDGQRPPSRLGDILVREGVVPRDVLEQAVIRTARGALVGEAVCQAGLTTPAQIRKVLKLQVAEQVEDLLSTDTGTWRWMDGASTAKRGPTVRLDPRGIVLRLVERAIESGHAARELARLRDASCTLTERADRLHGHFGGDDAWARVVAARPARMREAIRAAGADSVRVLFTMLALGALACPEQHLVLVGTPDAAAATVPPAPVSRAVRTPPRAKEPRESVSRRPAPAPGGGLTARFERVQEGLRLDPSDQRLRAERAWIISQMPHSDPDRRDRICLSQLEVVTQCEPQMAIAWEYLGKLLNRMGREVEGQLALERAAGIDPWGH